MLPEFPPMAEEDARRMNALRLAYIGDTVWDLLVRTTLVFAGKNLHHMHVEATSQVNAGAQSAALHRMEDRLTEQERDVVMRGRNAHAKHPTPKNQSPADYQAATGLEALIGYLYLTEQTPRLLELFHACMEQDRKALE
ncbi:MAG: ribonuclease III [Clostridia bacterium]|nr:ribonuclease III [Clostridia bacterium]